MTWPPATDPLLLPVYGVSCWLMLGLTAMRGVDSWYALATLVVVYLWLQVIFQLARRNSRVPRRGRQWLFIP